MWLVVLLLLLVGVGVGSLNALRHRRGTRAKGHRRWRTLLGGAVLACAALFVLAAWYFSDDLRCPADGEESNYGEAEWSWFPIGTTCRWTEAENGFDRVEEPGWAPTLLITGMVVAGLGLLLAPPPRRSDRT